MKNMAKAPRGTFYSRQNGQMVVTAWKDSRIMLTLSTCHQGWRDPDIHTLTRKIPDDITARRVAKIIAAPPQVCIFLVPFIRCCHYIALCSVFILEVVTIFPFFHL